MAIPMEAMEMEHFLPPEEIAERLTQMRRSKHEINNTDCTDKPEELVEDYSEDNADEGAKPPHNDTYNNKTTLNSSTSSFVQPITYVLGYSITC